MPEVYNKRTGHPPEAIYVGRPTRWGNPFPVEQYGRARCIEMFKVWVMEPEQEQLRQAARALLIGRDLVCWCVPADCHAFTWLEIANGL